MYLLFHLEYFFHRKILKSNQFYQHFDLISHDNYFVQVLLGFTQSQETQKTMVIAAMLESQTKEIIKVLLLRLLQHGRHDVRWKPAIRDFTQRGRERQRRRLRKITFLSSLFTSLCGSLGFYFLGLKLCEQKTVQCFSTKKNKYWRFY